MTYRSAKWRHLKDGTEKPICWRHDRWSPTDCERCQEERRWVAAHVFARPQRSRCFASSFVLGRDAARDEPPRYLEGSPSFPAAMFKEYRSDPEPALSLEPRAQNLLLAAMDEGISPMLLARLVRDEQHESPLVTAALSFASLVEDRGDSAAIRALYHWTDEEWAKARAFLQAGRKQG